MKPANFLIVCIFNWILWTFVKSTPIRKSLAIQVEKDNTETRILNDGAESSVNAQIRGYKLPKIKIIEKDKDKGADKVLDRSGYNKSYYQKNKEKMREYHRNYRKQNKERVNEKVRNNYQKNKEKILKRQKNYKKNNREKVNEYQRKYRQEKKNIQSGNNEGTSFDNPQTDDFIKNGKLPIDCQESFEEENPNRAEEKCNNSEAEHNQIEAEEPNKILEEDINQKELNKKIHFFDLNEMPDDEV
ncbi:unnamed protein product [Meloidogyne enterolobii]|uniref:Uncharacterized protein n=1 Tax=Meloidogyne enterolobii TaxID=390850 RepID=A0ACB0YC46_MELEN